MKKAKLIYLIIMIILATLSASIAYNVTGDTFFSVYCLIGVLAVAMAMVRKI